MRLRTLALALLLSALTAPPAPAQVVEAGEGPQLVDGIAAIVGSEIILKSEVELQLTMTLQQQGRSVEELSPQEQQELRSRILDQLIDESLIVERARRDTIEVSRSEVEDAIDQRIEQIRQGLGDEEALQEALRQEGMTLQEFRRRLRPTMENDLLRQKLMQELGIIGTPGPVSRREGARFLRENWQDMRAFRHILLTPPEGLEPETAAKERILELREQIVAGEADFADLAREHSQDPGSARAGGDLGTAPRGSYVEEFEETVWNLPVGEISEPVRTQYGWHLIQVTERTEDEQGREVATVRHILLRPDSGGALSAALSQEVGRVREALMEGMPFTEAVSRFSQEPGAEERGGYLGIFLIPLASPQNAQVNSDLPQEWARELQPLEPEGWTGPLEDEAGLHFLQRMPLTDEAVDRVLRYDFPKVERLVNNQRTQEKIQEWLARLREETYIKIRE
ncbi:MAG: peptidylprolyl isomerase [bacterium]